MKKKLLGLVLLCCLSLTVFAGCGTGDGDTAENEGAGTESLDPAEAIAGNYFTYSFNAEGYGQQTYFFHFYEEDPVMGAVFYFGNAGSSFAGTYEVVQEETPWACYPDREAATTAGGSPEEGTADYAVVFYDWDGNELGRCAYDGEILYNDQETMSIIGGDTVMYHLDTAEPEESQYASAYEDEKGVAYIAFVDPASEESTLELCHNMQFVDLMDTIIEGTWTREEQEDGSVKYTLTPDSGDAYEVVAAADGQTAVYRKDGAERMLNIVQEAQVTEAYQSEVFNYVSMNTDGQLTMRLYDDGTAELDVYFPAWDMRSPVAGTYEGTTLTMDQIGTLEIAGDTITLPASLGMSAEDVVLAKVDPTSLEQ